MIPFRSRKYQRQQRLQTVLHLQQRIPHSRRFQYYQVSLLWMLLELPWIMIPMWFIPTRMDPGEITAIAIQG